MNLNDWNKKQIEEALSNTNRYYFWLKYKRVANSDKELLEFYIQNGGAEDFARNHRGDR